jgi:hypothetical protein
MVQAFINGSILSWLTSDPMSQTNSFNKLITPENANHTKTIISTKTPQIALNLSMENMNCSSKSPAVKRIGIRSPPRSRRELIPVASVWSRVLRPVKLL